jgi:hypothetical protein
MQVFRIPEESLQAGVLQPIDFMDIAPLQWAQTYNLRGLQTTVEEQVGDAMLSSIRKQRLEHLPHLTAGSHIFHVWFSQFPWLCNDVTQGRS